MRWISPILADLKVSIGNVTVHLNGNLLLPNNITAVQQAINASSNQKSVCNAVRQLQNAEEKLIQTYATPWFYIHGDNVDLVGSNQSEW